MAITKTPQDTSREDAYWRENFRGRDYVAADDIYDDYGPAYAYGADAYGRHEGVRFEEIETDLSRDWEKFKGKSRLSWERAKTAVKDAWDRLTD